MNTENITNAIRYGYKRSLDVPLSEALERVRAALQKEGFGVLFELDLQAKLKEKLGVDFTDYIILGACNPALAYQTLQQEIDIGLLLPCNVIAYTQDGKSVVAAIDAQTMMTVVGNDELTSAAGEVSARLQRVIDNL